MPKVSIILPIYNVEKYLRQCLDSCINQTLKDIEIICVNDGSPDNCLEIINEYVQKDSRIKTLNQENQGLSIARNNGMDIATGEYILFLDSDDWLELDCCELAYNQAKENNNDFVWFSYFIYENNLQKITKDTSSRLVSCLKNCINDRNIHPKSIKTNWIKNGYVWNKLYNKSFLNENNIKYIDMAFEDYPYTIDVFLKAKSFSIIQKALYIYRKRSDSASFEDKNWKAIIDSRNIALNNILLSDNNKNILRAYINRYYLTLMHWYSLYTKKNQKIKPHFKKEFIKSLLNLMKYDKKALLFIVLIKTNTNEIFNTIIKFIISINKVGAKK